MLIWHHLVVKPRNSIRTFTNFRVLGDEGGHAFYFMPTCIGGNYRKLFAGRVDVIAIREPTLLTELKQIGFSTDDVAIAFSFGDDAPGWLITNLQTSEEMVSTLKDAYKIIQENHLIETLTKEYY